ncbi:MAG: hypothetical protein N3A65_08890 [candidate division WOR-3 bacterium]|nr:hypothetical protein [candidate division WOR-3 bacterium]
MKKIFLIAILLLNLVWAIQPVARKEKKNDEPAAIFEERQSDTDTRRIEIKIKDAYESKGDQFVDTDSNNVNDQREDDLLRIKQLKIKLKDLFKKEKEKESKPFKKPERRTK